MKSLKIRAVISISQSNYTEAKHILEEALKISIKIFGAESHPECIKIKKSVQECINNLNGRRVK